MKLAVLLIGHRLPSPVATSGAASGRRPRGGVRAYESTADTFDTDSGNGNETDNVNASSLALATPVRPRRERPKAPQNSADRDGSWQRPPKVWEVSSSSVSSPSSSPPYDYSKNTQQQQQQGQIILIIRLRIMLTKKATIIPTLTIICSTCTSGCRQVEVLSVARHPKERELQLLQAGLPGLAWDFSWSEEKRKQSEERHTRYHSLT